MGRAFYRFGHDIALRLADGQAFALKDAEIGVIFGPKAATICCLRGGFTAGSYRGLVARGVLPPDQELKALNQAVVVQLNLRAELAQRWCKDAGALYQIARRLDQNSLQDEVARNLLLFEVWQPAHIAAHGPKVVPQAGASPVADQEQLAATLALVSEMAEELWGAAETAGAAAPPQPLDEPMVLADAVKTFFDDEGWEWEAVTAAEDVLRTIYDGQNGSWMCYTRILPELEQAVFYSVCPVPIPASAVPTMLEFLTRANSELSLGNFEVDFGSNVVRFRTSVDVTDVGLVPLLFRNMVFQNLAVLDIYLPEILGIVAGRQMVNAAN